MVCHGAYLDRMKMEMVFPIRPRHPTQGNNTPENKDILFMHLKL
jgi:hypothetical protein